MLDMVKLVKEFMLIIDRGMEPVIKFPLKASLVKYIKFPMEVDKDPVTLFLVRSKVTTEKLLLQVTPNQPLMHGSPINQFVELIQVPPLVKLKKSLRA